MSVIQQVICLCFLLSLSCFWSVMCRPQLRPSEFKSRTAEAKTEVGANSQPFATLASRSLKGDGSLSVEEAGISILFKLQIFPFRKPNNELAVDARNGDLPRDNGVWGTGIEFGLPNGAGFGYGQDASFNTFSFSSVSYIFKG
ncbi:uncharacterized protein LOC116929023 [Daphnia magna]|uniref:uncharacterized protein LOC116929023 n=1 Tax=Daphnia magna TaxID=35525 RepID=UPI001E1BDB69|nr:uncharacterized protein LOC116929023 [Daphnia magna]